jgi:GT2 family glycosyltransferase
VKILLFCPLNPERNHKGDQTPQLFGRTNQSIFRQDYPVIDIMFSKGDNPYFDNNGRHNIAHNYNKARRLVLDNGYDYLFTVEADMILPSNALSKLLEQCEDGGADVAYGLYVFKNSNTWSAFTELHMDGGRGITKDPDKLRAAWGKVIPVAGVGSGCTLIKRNVLEALEFRTDETRPTLHHDWCFANDAQHAGFKQVCDLSVVCGHISMKPSPRVIWPDPEMPRFYRNDFIEGIPVNERGEVEIEIGQFGEFYIPKSALLIPTGRSFDEIKQGVVNNG